MSTSEPEASQLGDEIERVVADFERRTLDEMPGGFSRLVYLASLRDYNTGRYHHYGLETRYSSEAVDEALRRCHAKVFEELLARPLQAQSQDLLGFFESLKDETSRLVKTWQTLRSYQMLPPEECHPLARELFDKNVDIILNILKATDLWPLLCNAHSDPDHLP